MVLLVRHATTPTTGKVLPGRARGLHLSEAGRSEADRAAERLAGTAVAAVYASPLERARETALPIGGALGCPVVVDRQLVECDFGAWTGEELSKLRRLPEWSSVQRWPSGWRFPEGESFAEVQSRMAAALAHYREAHRGEVVVAVSHADCIKAALASCLGLPLDLFQRINVGPASTSAVAFGPEGPYVLAVSSYGPIPALGARPAREAKPAPRLGARPGRGAERDGS
ncbi:MAG: MSMEG_4193 family putative phosphomutase [Acidimicrobiales bacterium]